MTQALTFEPDLGLLKMPAEMVWVATWMDTSVYYFRARWVSRVYGLERDVKRT